MYLEQARSIYSTINDVASKDGENQTKSLPSEGKAGDKMLGRLLFAYAVAFDAKRCSDARMTLLNFEAKGKLEEKITAEEYDKLMETLTELSSSADNYLTNPKMVEATQAIERLQLRKAQSFVKQAYDLVAANRPPAQ